MLKMTMHCDHTVFRRFSNFQFSLVQGSGFPVARWPEASQKAAGQAKAILWLARFNLSPS